MPIYKKDDILKIKESSRIVKEVKALLKEHIKEGVSLKELDKIAYDFIIENGATPSFLGYQGFKGSICVSVNEVMIHGVPTDYRLKDKDIISIDVGAYKNEFHGDSAFTVGVGNISEQDQLLLTTTLECLEIGLEHIKHNVALGVVGEAIEKHAKSKGFYLSEDYAGHGVGRTLHEEPFVFNVKDSPYKDVRLKEGMVIAVEPMVLIGSKDTFIDPVDK
jgi:methionyl aminopeptidase